MSQAVTLNVAINSHNNALLTLLISNNFVEIKSNVFKRLGKENLHKLAYLDTVERFHIMAHLLFVLVQNVLTSEEPWAVDLALNALMIVVCEVLVDVIKHAFLAKFNEMKPAVYGGFLQSLCWQTVQSGSHQVHKTLSFVPLAPACVVVRVVSPLLPKILPAGPPWLTALLAMLVCVCSIAVLTLSKVVLGLGLQMHARWYLNRCIQKGLAHPHQD
ncbi:hypothetical protein KFL_005300100 [Klebsormidium nitens]|uniref:Uncharacterized protein n=1 Tax=Klebsormidium nitens TaxID=105231 RepID=A0A1Y1IL65_KLENI|nr:hypothetical protein KFL_005300100 [Klebsormidium nitens]|eukprot:GAQ89506.1 hypothetical protein KFL_005300100 [Klebsormidium nitens]